MAGAALVQAKARSACRQNSASISRTAAVEARLHWPTGDAAHSADLILADLAADSWPDQQRCDRLEPAFTNTQTDLVLRLIRRLGANQTLRGIARAILRNPFHRLGDAAERKQVQADISMRLRQAADEAIDKAIWPRVPNNLPMEMPWFESTDAQAPTPQRAA